MPDTAQMYLALVEKDASFEGIFFAGIQTTGIFCRPSCPARKPRPENVEYFPRAADALAAGYRPCLRCRPMEVGGATPAWLADILKAVDADPSRRWTESDLRMRGVDPNRARRWFQDHHGMTFLAYLRARRLGQAFSRIRDGSPVLDSALDAGFDSLSGFMEAFRKKVGTAPSKAKQKLTLKVKQVPTPLGPMVVAGDEKAVYLAEFWDRRMLETQVENLEERLQATLFPGSTPALDQAERELAEYFEGRRSTFTQSLFRFPGTEHQRMVWRALLKIPYGRTVSYGELAASVGKGSAVRAVARAVGENRLAIVLPCHRVVGADGNLTGYGGGLWRKKFLLELEGGREG